MDLVTAEVLQNVFRLKIGNSTFTGFTIVREKRQYLITAKHCLEELDQTIEFQFDTGWHAKSVVVVGHAAGDIDISILTLNEQLGYGQNLAIGFDGFSLSQDVFFLGFPFGIFTNIGVGPLGHLIPFVKKATVAGFMIENNRSKGLFLDGINNVGFSGGPVVDTLQKPKRVIGVVSGFEAEKRPVLDPDGDETDHYVTANTGIISAYSMEFAIQIIDRNPIGFPDVVQLK